MQLLDEVLAWDRWMKFQRMQQLDEAFILRHATTEWGLPNATTRWTSGMQPMDEIQKNATT